MVGKWEQIGGLRHGSRHRRRHRQSPQWSARGRLGAARSKLAAGRRTRLSIVRVTPRARAHRSPLACARAPQRPQLSIRFFVCPTERCRQCAQNNTQRKPTFEPVIVYKRPMFNSHKLLERNIAALLFCERVPSVLQSRCEQYQTRRSLKSKLIVMIAFILYHRLAWVPVASICLPNIADR